MTIAGHPFFCSWSGGKDSSLSLLKAVRAGWTPSALLTMMTESGDRSRSHGLRLDVVRAQADSLGIPLITRSASWTTYEDVFRQTVSEFAAQGVTGGVFGDIDLDEHRAWCVRVCREAGAAAHHPLWKMDRMDVVREFLDAGFQAYIVAMKDDVDNARCTATSSVGSGVGSCGSDRCAQGNRCSDLIDLLGKPFDRSAVDLMVERGVDACGEAGEFHTIVTDGPMFSRPMRPRFGQPILKDGYWFVDVEVDVES